MVKSASDGVKAPEEVDQVDRSVVANPAQARQLLAAVTYVGRLSGRGKRLRAMYACMYYGGLRPSEATGLRREDCELPDLCACTGECSCGLPVSAWGRLTLTRSRPSPGRLTPTADRHMMTRASSGGRSVTSASFHIRSCPPFQ
jgi:hypothetical protein